LPPVLLCCAVLCCAVLCCAVLCCAVLCCAVLCCAALCSHTAIQSFTHDESCTAASAGRWSTGRGVHQGYEHDATVLSATQPTTSIARTTSTAKASQGPTIPVSPPADVHTRSTATTTTAATNSSRSSRTAAEAAEQQQKHLVITTTASDMNTAAHVATKAAVMTTPRRRLTVQ
jgi:hypothetical protein